ncbi:MAG TPA: HEAT repeat domain-containing protein [Polyangia bacterium]
MPLTCLAIVLSVLAAKPAPAPAGNELSGRARFEVYLATHDVPVAEDLRALAPAPENALMAIASDVHADGLQRSRAVAALRLVPSAAVHVFLGKLIQAKAKATDATDRLIVRRAAVALGWMSGTGAAETLALLFDNEDADVRLDAAIGLGLTRAATAAPALRRQLAVEQAPRVRDQIERQLRALGESPAAPEKAPAPKQETPMRGSW